MSLQKAVMQSLKVFTKDIFLFLYEFMCSTLKQDRKLSMLDSFIKEHRQSEIEPEKQLPWMSGERVDIFSITFDIFPTS